METLVIHVKAEFIDKSILGSQPNSEDIYSEFIASKAPEGKDITAQIEAVGAAEVEEKGTTVFARDKNGNPCLFDYHILGFLKEAMGRLRENKGSACSKVTSYKKKIDGNLFVRPCLIPIENHGEIGINQRSLRASTAQGDRTALASSEEIHEGATIEFRVEVNLPSLKQAIYECLSYGKDKGLGQWRNAGHGRFNVTKLQVEKVERDLVSELPIEEI